MTKKDFRTFVSEKYIYPVYSSQTENHGILGYYKDFLAENVITWTADGVKAGVVNFRKGKFYATGHCGILTSKKYPENEFFAIGIGLQTKKRVSRSIVPSLKSEDIARVELKFTPDISEQGKISQLFETFENLVNELEEKWASWKILKMISLTKCLLILVQIFLQLDSKVSNQAELLIKSKIYLSFPEANR
ncbi:restriction endonuclease subunit S [Mesomycoplasma ovipneumoniae]|uniref:restriction endonuclease subunit S n=1 Tax=Mesomycoplasma ovipneumoniae TaxID=29562 RepID=UPI002965C41A|nr:restriction endonuclease subunit S [Mesomycoplasma ovipneumoniae]